MYPSGIHWILIKENMAAEVLAKLCRREHGVEKAIEFIMNYKEANNGNV